MSDSYARGGRPHSVPDPDGKAYDAMIRKHQALMAQKQAEAARPSAPNRHSQIDAAVSGIAQTLNGARSARHEFEQGHVAHSRIRGKSIKASLPRFTPFERYVHGTPRWWKAANVAAVGHATQIAGDHLPGHSPQRSTHKK